MRRRGLVGQSGYSRSSDTRFRGSSGGWTCVRSCQRSFATTSVRSIARHLDSFWGAVLGSVVGGLISWVLAKQAGAESRQRDAAARDVTDSADALRLMVKASLVLS